MRGRGIWGRSLRGRSGEGSGCIQRPYCIATPVTYTKHFRHAIPEGRGGGGSEGTRRGEGCYRTYVVKPWCILKGSTTPLHPLAHYISTLYTHAHPPTPPHLATHTLKKMHSVRYQCNHFVLQTFPARYTSIYIHTPQLMYASLPASSPRHAHGLGKKGILFGTATPATHTNVPCTLWPIFSNLSALKHIHLTRLFKDLWLFSRVVL